MMADTSKEPGPIAKAFHRTKPYYGCAGVKDAKGQGLNLTLFNGKLLTPHGVDLFNNIKGCKIREDDVVLCGYPKTGCHWLWEITSMVRKGKAELSDTGKQVAYIEMVPPAWYEALPSPRVLNTHVQYDMLPDGVLKDKNKILLTVRNPKDVAVSLYNHHINLEEIYQYKGEFNDWFQLFLDGKVDNGQFVEYHKDWDRVIREHPDHPILVVKYEDMVEDALSSVRKVATFLDANLTEDQIQAIVKASEIKAMKKKCAERAMESLIRKGQVGDWKNWLNEDQSKALDSTLEQLKGTSFETRCEL